VRHNSIRLFRLLGAVVVLAAPLPLVLSGTAGADVSIPCVRTDINDCTVTIALTSNMDERFTSVMPDKHPWQFNFGRGNGAPYGVTGTGNEQTTWNGVPAALNGTVFSAILTTGSNEPAGGVAVLGFGHVTPIKPATPYNSVFVAAPARAVQGSVITIHAVVIPVPAKGHVILQRNAGKSWANASALTYVATTRLWTVSMKWLYPKNTTRAFRLLATAAPGLSATYSKVFRISTLP
jgi:hypothetical protein